MAKIHLPDVAYEIKEFGLGESLSPHHSLVSIILFAQKVQTADMAPQQEIENLHFLFGSIESAHKTFQQIADHLAEEKQK